MRHHIGTGRSRRRLALVGVPLTTLAIALASCGVLEERRGSSPQPTLGPTRTGPTTPFPTPGETRPTPPTPTGPTPAPGPPPVLLAAGDIGRCDKDGDENTAAVIAGRDGMVVPLGDLAYPDGSFEDFAECYAPSWGAFRDRTLPVIGNHEYVDTETADAYFSFFGDRAGRRDQGWWSLDLGSWHLVALNTNCDEAGGCDAGSPQETWLRQDLAASGARCTIAFSHHPRFSSGHHGDDDDIDGLWRALYDGGVDIVLSGHDHNYERFAPQDPDGRADPEHGIVAFVVGTGGTGLRDMEETRPNSVVHDNRTHGVLELTLAEGEARYRFLPAAGEGSFSESGTIPCHDAPSG